MDVDESTKPETLEVTVAGPAHPGAFVARADSGEVIFVQDAVDGERVRVEITQRKRRWARAHVVEVLEPSKFRRPNVWAQADYTQPLATRLGGVDYGHILPAHQRDLKAQVLRDAMQRVGKLDTLVVANLSSVAEVLPTEHYRTRIELSVATDGTPGQRSFRGHDIHPVDSLPLAVPQLEDLGAHHQRFPGAQRLTLVAPSTGEPMVIVDGKVQAGPHAGSGARRVPVVMQVGQHQYKLAADGFWQVHQEAAPTLVRAVKNAIDWDRVNVQSMSYDLYGGVGLFAGELVAKLGQVTTVEGNAVASKYAARNLRGRARAVHADVRKFARELSIEAHPGAVVVLDPPRTGAGLEVVENLVAAQPEQIVYVACDPVALARDAGEFARLGWEMTSLSGFDVFPNTHHVEAVAAFNRVN